MTLLTADTNLQLKWTILHSSSCSLQLSKHSVVPDNNNYYHMTESLYTFTKYSRTFQNVETSLWYAFQHDFGTVAISRYLSSQLLFHTFWSSFSLFPYIDLYLGMTCSWSDLPYLQDFYLTLCVSNMMQFLG